MARAADGNGGSCWHPPTGGLTARRAGGPVRAGSADLKRQVHAPGGELPGAGALPGSFPRAQSEGWAPGPVPEILDTRARVWFATVAR